MAAPWLPLLLALFLPLSTVSGASIPTNQNNAQCSVSPKDRTNCGSPGISANDCVSRGCCFNSSLPGVKWCFNPKQADSNARCSVSPQDRTDCGSPGISEKVCLSQGCCFNSRVPGVKWCFNPYTGSPPQQPAQAPGQQPTTQTMAVVQKPSGGSESAVEEQPLIIVLGGGPAGAISSTTGPSGTGCEVSHKLRKDCGYPNISSKDCHSRGCCFDNSIPETIWCFYGYK